MPQLCVTRTPYCVHHGPENVRTMMFRNAPTMVFGPLSACPIVCADCINMGAPSCSNYRRNHSQQIRSNIRSWPAAAMRGGQLRSNANAAQLSADFSTEGRMVNVHCSICGRKLERACDPLSVDCGGDCWGCVRPLEKGYAPSNARIAEEIQAGHRELDGTARPPSD